MEFKIIKLFFLLWENKKDAILYYQCTFSPLIRQITCKLELMIELRSRGLGGGGGGAGALGHLGGRKRSLSKFKNTPKTDFWPKKAPLF